MGQVLKVLEGHTDIVSAVAISIDGAKIVSGSVDKTVRVWSMETGEVPACLRVMEFVHQCVCVSVLRVPRKQEIVINVSLFGLFVYWL